MRNHERMARQKYANYTYCDNGEIHGILTQSDGVNQFDLLEEQLTEL
jgi:hypothetical protein